MMVKTFNHISSDDVALAGGKGASLGEMTQAGIPVPSGFVVLAPAFDQFLDDADLRAEIDATLHAVNHEAVHSVNEASEKIRALIESADVSASLTSSIQESFAQLGADYVAVRSSATSEDSADAAWAGQLETYLNTTEKDLLTNIKKCWSSLFTPRAIFYRFEKGLHGTPISVAVVVQKMVNSEKSGIAFSVHPVTQDHNQMIIESGFGLGEAIVSGEITPDSFVIEKDAKQIVESNVHVQSKQLVRDENGGNEWQDLGEAGKAVSLSNDQVLELAKHIQTIEDHYGFPVDVEWAYEGGEIHITQSRPITTLRRVNSVEKIKLVKLVTREASLAAVEPWYQGMVDEIATFFDIPKYETILSYRDGVFERYVVENFQSEVPTIIAKWIRGHEDQLEVAVNRQLEAILFAKRLRAKAYSDPKAIVDDLSQFCEVWRTGFIGLVVTFYLPLWQETYKKRGYALFDASVISQVKAWRHDAETFFDDGVSVIDDLIAALSEVSKIDIDLLRLCTLDEIGVLLSRRNDATILEHVKERERGFAFADNRVMGKKEIGAHLANNGWYIPEVNTGGSFCKGNIANSGMATGKVRVVFTKKQLASVCPGDILVAPMTTPWYLPAMKKSGAIVTDEGGVTCHAAIVSRELGIPCIIGTGDATRVLKDGMDVEVDAENGVVRVLNPAMDDDPWILVESIPGSDIFFFQHGFRSIVRDSSYDFMRPLGKLMAVYTGLHMDFYMTERSATEWSDHILNNFVERQRFARDVHEHVMEWSAKLKSYGEQLAGLDLGGYSGDQLYQLYKEHEQIHTKLYNYCWYPVQVDILFGNFTSRLKSYLMKVCADSAEIEKAFVLLTSPTEKTVVAEERGDLLTLYDEHHDAVKDYVENGVGITDALQKALDVHRDTWGHLGYTFAGETGVFPLDHYLEELSELVETNADTGAMLANAQRRLEDIAKDQMSFYKEHNTPEIERRLFQAAQDFALSKLFRRDAQLYTLHKLHTILLEEIARRLNVTRRHVQFMLWYEVGEALESGAVDKEELDLRLGHCVYLITEDEEAVYTGEAADAFERQIKVEVDFDGDEIAGQTAQPGHATGEVKVIIRAEDMQKMNEGDILVSIATDPDIVSAMKKAGAIVTDQGGITSHAAIVSRELGTPCVIGTKVASKVLKDGDLVEVDADKGVVKILKVAAE